MVDDLTDMQKEAIKKFWGRAKPLGWEYAEEFKVIPEGDGTICTLVLTFIGAGGDKHRLRVTPNGNLSFAPFKIPGLSY